MNTLSSSIVIDGSHIRVTTYRDHCEPPRTIVEGDPSVDGVGVFISSHPESLQDAHERTLKALRGPEPCGGVAGWCCGRLD